jgi:hypothetical protein
VFSVQVDHKLVFSAKNRASHKGHNSLCFSARSHIIMDLEEGIKKHLDSQHKWILLQNNPVINRHQELHIRTREQAPRSSADLERRITAKIL